MRCVSLKERFLLMSDDRRTTPLDPEPIEPQMCTIDLRLQILHGLPFFAGLSHDDIAAINPLFREMGFEPGAPIYYAGDEANRLYVVAAGKVKLIRYTPGGQERVLDLLLPGDFFGTLPVMGEATYPDTAQAHTVCCALSISAQDFQTILERYPAVSLSLLEIVSDRLRAAREMIHQSSAAPVESRIASLLLRLVERAGEEGAEGWLIQMPLGRQDIADMLGITVETASRALSRFRKDGLIRSGRRWIAIADRDRLADLAQQPES